MTIYNPDSMNFADRWYISIASIFFAISMGLILSFKQPQCVESKIVKQIEVHWPSDQVETVFQCGQFQKIPYSAYFDKNLDGIESRIEAVNFFLKSLSSNSIKKAGTSRIRQSNFSNPIEIKINFRSPILFSVQDHKIEIGDKLLRAEGHLERGLLKIWVLEQLKKSTSLENTESALQIRNLNASKRLFVEVITDYLLMAMSGDIVIEDPLLRTKTKNSGIRWPQVLKSKESYCESAWRLSEHYSDCEQLGPAEELQPSLLLTLSLRPLLSSALANAYAGLSFFDRMKFLGHFSRYLQAQSISSEKAIEMLINDAHPLKDGLMGIKKITDLVHASPLMQDEPEYREFSVRFTQQLQQSGVADSFAEAYFDYLFEYPDTIFPSSKFFTDLQQLSIQNPHLQIALRDKSQMWILPSKTSLPNSTFDEVRAQQLVYLACLGLKEISMPQFFKMAEKLLLLKGCDQNKKVDFASLIKGGVREFSVKNNQLSFIQFHLPSFEMKAKELIHIKNFFELVKSRDVSKPEFQTLGWRQVQWSQESLAYKPQAAVDAIELFRVELN